MKDEFQNKKKSDETYWWFAQISPSTNTDGLITHFVKVAEDITAQKEAGSWILVGTKRPPARRSYGSERNPNLSGMLDRKSRNPNHKSQIDLIKS